MFDTPSAVHISEARAGHSQKAKRRICISYRTVADPSQPIPTKHEPGDMSLCKMAQWPPSPSVEDEATALAHEHSLDASIQVLQSEDQPALSRGSVDQYPVIVDSDSGELPRQEERKHVKHDSTSETHAAYDSAYSSGPATPPPMVRSRRRSKSDETLFKHNTEPRTITSNSGYPSPIEERSSTYGRPQVTRIQTDLGSGLGSTAGRVRREPSPYSNKGMTSKSRQNSAVQPPDNYMLSPSRAADSPISLHQQLRQPPPPQSSNGIERASVASVDRRPPLQPNERSVGNTVGRDGPRSRVERPESHRSPQVDVRRSFAPVDNYGRQPSYEKSERRGVNGPMSPPHSRRESRDSTYDLSNGNWANYPRHSSSRQSARDAKESPHTSSAEDSSREHRRRQERDTGIDRKRSRRRSSHRKERRELTDLAETTRPVTLPNSAVDGASRYRRDSRLQGRPDPITPLTADPAHNWTSDYFENAFKANDNRKSQGLQGYHSSGSVLVSPMTSRPSTPRSERHSKDYFEIPVPAQHSSLHSPRPSMDEGPSRDAKAYGSLLSAATNGAAIAARASNNSSRSPTHSTEAFVTPSTTRAPSASQSRRQSFARDEPRPPVRNASYGNLEASHSLRDPLAPTSNSSRPIPRGGLNGAENSSHHNTHRAMSYSGSDQHTSWNENSTASGLGLRNVPSLNIPNQTTATTYDRGTKTPTNSYDAPILSAKALVLPVCPRSQPSTEYHDWYTIKGISDLDVCPTCVKAVKSTRYQHLFVPSLPRPYGQPSVCAMSNAWVRVAFIQSLKQIRPDLAYIKAVVSPPTSVIECAGSKTDLRRWFDIIDPSTKKAIPDFLVCSACARRVDMVFPDLNRVFDRPDDCLARERICSLHAAGTHFHPIIEQLEQAHDRCDGRLWRAADVEGLVRYIRRLTNYLPCQRDAMQTSKSWHFMPDLPEFTVCEECYDDVVWPLSDRPIARDICKTSKPVPTKTNSEFSSPLSCQLYSERMRKVFRDAVAQRDFSKLRDAAKTRLRSHLRLLEMNHLFEQDQRYGIDRRADLERNQEIWRSIE